MFLLLSDQVILHRNLLDLISVMIVSCSMKSVIDRYGRAKEDEQLVANPNSELKVCLY
jgi:hypothetical protein